MKKIFFSIFVGVLVLVFSGGSSWAQATAQVSGTARDQSGAVLPGVEITVTQTDTGISRNTLTNETGSYVLPNLATGPYRLEAVLPGFRTYAQTGIVLQVNGSPVVNVVLEVGQVAETVEVQANAALVETRSASLGSVIENERILELPLNGRNVTDLITLAGGAVQQGTTSVNFVAGSPLLAVAGSAGWGTAYTLDGASHISFMSGTTMMMPFPDAMQEFKVETAGAGAQRGSSSAVDAVTKSGTNEFHGDLFEFVRNDLFNARSYFATRHGTLKRNQFGGTIGGPIVRNKLFFFGGYQGTTIRSDPADTRVFIPTPAMLAGDWTAFASPGCNAGRQITLRAPFVNNRVDPALYSRAALYVVNWKKAPMPFPTTNDPCGQFTYGNLSRNNQGQYVAKVDYQKSARHSLLGRALIFRDKVPNPAETFNTNLIQRSRGSDTMQQAYVLGSTYLVDANTVQAFRLSVGRSGVYFTNFKLFNWCDAGVKIYCDPIATERIGGPSITGGFSMGDGANEFMTGHKYFTTTYSMNDDLSLVRGAHQMAFGMSASHGRDATFSTTRASTNTIFNGSATGLGLADFMLGRLTDITLARPNPHHVNGTIVAAYATDTWKTTRNLTLSPGIRWEPYLPQNAAAIYNFDYNRFREGIKSTVFVNAPAGVYYRGDAGFPKNAANVRWWQFAPRLGLAWDVSGNGQTSIRASYAYSYVFPPGNYRQVYSGGPPWGNRLVLTAPVGGLDDPWQGVPGGNIFPYVLEKNTPYGPSGLYYTQPYDQKNTSSQSWNLNIQRAAGKDWLVSASYMGSGIRHMWMSNSLNPATYFPGGPCTLNGVTYNPCSSLSNTDARRRFSLERPADGAKMGYVAENDDGGTQNYHGMLLSVQRRAARGVTVNANYTWSHCVGDDGNVYNPMNDHPNNTYTHPNNRHLDRGNCLSDRRHIFNLTSVAEAPEFSNRALRVLAGGWRLSGIYRYSSGSPLTILAGSDRALNGVDNQRAVQLLENPFGDRSARPLTNYINQAAFVLPVVGTIGNAGNKNIPGPPTWSFDAALSRVFRFREDQRLEFRAEAYNVTNSFVPGNPNTTVSSNVFGVIRTSAAPRIMQFALKYVF